ncbi:Cytochrome b6-f complex subunit 4 [Maioricimonas rarisocia]|uniref:Cytochrome b6-f complex subunit 4 n=1 Tax=Maioricimonas rarisocia TaxID=2528026 RepID=A0A517Z1T3_9PLAN|nr:hypothetical protein [Maioricimonas rarisocia]QDU36452.1 Cytochrome b6-f complex subunit 4 [Maioricimonas rarisocia]
MNPHPDLTTDVIRGLGWMYLVLAVMNVGWTVRSYQRDGYFESFMGIRHMPKAALWAVYTAILLLIAVAHLTTTAAADEFFLRLVSSIKDPIDVVVANPISFFGLSIALFVALIMLREWLTRPTVGWVLLNLSLLATAVSMTDYDFRQIVGKPDNVPIVGLLFLVGYFTWLYFRKANDNDRRLEQGKPLHEEELNEQVLVWPDLVYTEMICMLLLTALLIFWGVALQAPLEEPASAVKTPNPSKAPWYFLGLQEMLVYFDPWMAGVVLPTVILLGLMAIPYIDFNKKGNGYYCFNDRKFAVITFLFGFLPLWIGMIILGTFLRGPNWNMFGPYEYWDVHKLELLNNNNLSDYFWTDLLRQPLPRPTADDTVLSATGIILTREAPGILLVLGYLLLLPPLMAATVFRSFFAKMGFLRFMVLANLVLFMASLPLKMAARWAFQLKYIVAIPEWFFNI